jgi:integral membrane protein (TIGR01906 family)
MKSSTLRQALAWIVTILVPVALVLTAVRAMFSPLFLRFEYNTPGFPPDPIGFTQADRLRWSQYAVDYLVNSAGISYLGDLRFDDGRPQYNERELEHMVDVKNTVQAAFKVWYFSLAALLVLGVWAWRGGWWAEFRHGLQRGGWLSIFLLGTIILLALLSFGVLFVAFHNVFFAPGTWTFEYSDTLIRLFPERFWRDIFIYIGVLSIAGGLLLALGLKPRKSY